MDFFCCFFLSVIPAPLLLKYLILLVFILAVSVSYSIFFRKTLHVNLLLVLLLYCFLAIIHVDNVSFCGFVSHLVDFNYVVKSVAISISTHFHWALKRLLG